MKRGTPIRAHVGLARYEKQALEVEAPVIQGLSSEFRAIRDGLYASSLGSVRRMGEILEEGRRLLKKDEYESWLRSLCASDSAAKNYRRVFRLSKDDPPIYARCVDLQIDNVYRLATVPKDDRARVLEATFQGRCVSDLGTKQFRSLVREVLGRHPPVRTEAAFASKLPERLDSAIAVLEEALTMRPRVFAENRRQIVVKLQRICPLAIKLARNLRGRGSVRRTAPPAPSVTAPPAPAPTRTVAAPPKPPSPTSPAPIGPPGVRPRIKVPR